MYELQLFDAGAYVPVLTGDDPDQLMKHGRQHNGPRRVVSLKRGEPYFRYSKPLPLKPRSLTRRWRFYKPGSSIEPLPEDRLLSLAIDHYRAREGKEPVTVYTWRGSRFGMELHAALQHGRFRFVELDPYEPGSALGPLEPEQLQCAA